MDFQGYLQLLKILLLSQNPRQGQLFTLFSSEAPFISGQIVVIV